MRFFLIIWMALSWLVKIVVQIAKLIYIVVGFVVVGLFVFGILALMRFESVVDELQSGVPFFEPYWDDTWTATRDFDEFPEEFILSVDIDVWLENAQRSLDGMPWKLVLANTAEKWAEDERIKGVIFRTSRVSPSIAEAQFLNRIFSQFRDSDIRTFAHVGSYLSLTSYALLQNAEKIWTSPTTLLQLNGYGGEQYYYGDVVRALGMSSVLVKRSEYKSAGDSLALSRASEFEREQVMALLDDWYAQSKAIATSGRGFAQRSDFDAIVNTGIFTPSKALNESVIEGIGYYDEVEEEITEMLLGSTSDEEDKVVNLFSYMIAAEQDKEDTDQEEKRVLYLDLEGPIYAASGGGGFFSDNYYGINLLEWKDILQGLAEDDTVDGVIMRLSSPGGEVFASDELSAVMRSLSQAKPLIVLVDSVAASGGYYMASSADKIVMEKGAITGSIGVVFQYLEYSQLLYNLGINVESYRKGRFSAGWLSPSRRPTFEEFELLNEGADYFYQQFVSTVAEGRGLSFERAFELAKGRVWSGAAALENGLADVDGNLPEAVAEMKLLLDLEEDERIVVQTFQQQEDFGDFIERLQRLQVLWNKISMAILQVMHSVGLNAEGRTESLMMQYEPRYLHR